MTTSTPKTIEITVKPDGSTSLETKGFAGNGCRAASEFLERALGSRGSEQLTSEFHQGQTVNQQTTQQR
ncbi:MAG: DUF2997 domain-containing protein [Rhodopirellula sp.]|nr:DUF2997 domain-containing protein [Rhodopirellula sp.]